jgi:hypothetical protein
VLYNFYSGGQAPSVKSTTEEIVKLPIVSNVLGRFLQVSDYGVTERLNQIKDNAKTDAARISLANDKVINKYVEQAMGKSLSERMKIEREMIKERFDGSPKSADEVTQAKGMISKYRESVIKAVSGPEIDALATATSNKEKTAIIKDIKNRLTEDEFAQFRQTSIQNGLVSAEVFNKLQQGAK